MSFQLLPPLILFALTMSITPGPNNLMLMTSGANYGFRRTLPHMMGVGIGFTLMVAAIGLGLVQIFELYPVSHTILKVVSVVYLVWLAWKFGTAKSATPDAPEAAGKPMTFLQAAAFQWVNPKAWAMALTAISAYAPDQTVLAVVLVAAVFGAVNLPSIGIWVVAGQQMRRFLTNPGRLRAFNITMAVLILATLWPVLRAA